MRRGVLDEFRVISGLAVILPERSQRIRSSSFTGYSAEILRCLEPSPKSNPVEDETNA